MQWYQKFEYAVGHWLQKATEHVLGCVLCSPGCFSLFRGWAVMDDNVMRTYTTLPSLPQHYVQYDQAGLPIYSLFVVILRGKGWNFLKTENQFYLFISNFDYTNCLS